MSELIFAGNQPPKHLRRVHAELERLSDLVQQTQCRLMQGECPWTAAEAEEVAAACRRAWVVLASLDVGGEEEEEGTT